MKLLTALLLSTWALWAAGPEPLPERQCTLRFAWWSQPEETCNLALLQGKEIIPVVALEMNLELTKNYRGPANLTLLKKKTNANATATPPANAKVDPKAKPGRERLEDWEPLTTVALPDSSEVGIILFLNETKQCLARAFDYDPKRFPYGSLRLINLTRYGLAGHLNQANFHIGSGGNEALPVLFRDRTVSVLAIDSVLNQQIVSRVLETKIIGYPNHRGLIFVLELPATDSTEPPKFETRSIDSILPVPTAAPGPSKDAGTKKAGKNQPTKP